MDVGKNLEAMSFKQDITIPDLKIENAQEIDISNLNKALIAIKADIDYGHFLCLKRRCPFFY